MTSVKSKVKGEVWGEKKGNLASFCTHYSKAYSSLVPRRKEFLHWDLPEEGTCWVNQWLPRWIFDQPVALLANTYSLPTEARLPQSYCCLKQGFQERGNFKYAMPFFLGLKELTAAKTRHAHNMGSVRINLTVKLCKAFGSGRMWHFNVNCAERRAVAQTFGSLGQYSSSKDLSPINSPIFS